MKQLIYTLLITLFIFTIFSCKKGKGAICNDGTRSYSTGQGTCSWHGGIDHYVDPDEIDIPNTIKLSLALVAGFFIAVASLKDR